MTTDLDPFKYKAITSRAKFLKGAMESVEMFDSMGNCAAAAIFDCGPGLDGKRVFEAVFWDFNSSVHRAYKSDLATAKMRYNAFFYRKQAEGFDCVQTFQGEKNIV